ncbi:MAG: hypothetical protein KJ749_13835 [Planctomycetes bacterium]|nr:hypothetical protein [Planctomycetota bacterium]
MGTRLMRLALSLGLLVVAVFACGCATTGAREQALTGDPAHERHATGIESQAADN